MTSLPLQVSHDGTNHCIFYVNVHDAFVDKRIDTWESKTMPKWLMQTLRESRLDESLSYHTRLGYHSAFIAS